MGFTRNPRGQLEQSRFERFRFASNRHPAGTNWVRTFACLVGIASLTGAAQPGQQPPTNTGKPNQPTEANRPPGVNQQVEMRDQQGKELSPVAGNEERKKQISDDSAKLLKLATELKSEVDKTTKDTLSLNVIRKAGEIESLARSVKEKMKPSTGAN